MPGQSAYKGNQISEETLALMVKNGIPPEVINMVRAGKPTLAQGRFELSMYRMREREDSA